VEPTEATGKHDRDEHDTRPEDEHMAGPAQIEFPNATDEQVADGQVEETPKHECVSRRTAGRKSADASPICSSMAATPYLTGKVTYGFAEVGARARMNLGPDGVTVSIPGSELQRIVANLKEMRSKKAFGV
jgi:hypothetical protein